MTIQGGGFTKNTRVTLNNGVPCEEVIVNSYDEIVCVTSSSSSEMVVEVDVTVDSIPAACELTNCTFEYISSLTPEVTDVSPNTVEAIKTVFNVSGTGFGANSSLLSVEIGGEECAIDDTTFSDVQFKCTLSVGLPFGDYKMVVHKDDDGWAKYEPITLCDITSSAVLASVTPSSGSTEGGTIITLSGNGFTTNLTSILLDGATCGIEILTPSEVKCKTRQHDVQDNVDVTASIESGGVTITFTGSVIFNYTSVATPTLTAISPVSGTGGDSVTISGSRFSTTPTENIVIIGGMFHVFTATYAYELFLEIVFYVKYYSEK